MCNIIAYKHLDTVFWCGLDLRNGRWTLPNGIFLLGQGKWWLLRSRFDQAKWHVCAKGKLARGYLSQPGF